MAQIPSRVPPRDSGFLRTFNKSGSGRFLNSLRQTSPVFEAILAPVVNRIQKVTSGIAPMFQTMFKNR